MPNIIKIIDLIVLLANGPIYYNSDDGLFELQTLTEPGMQPEPITATAFDPFEEVLWTGTGSVRYFKFALIAEFPA